MTRLLFFAVIALSFGCTQLDDEQDAHSGDLLVDAHSTDSEHELQSDAFTSSHCSAIEPLWTLHGESLQAEALMELSLSHAFATAAGARILVAESPEITFKYLPQEAPPADWVRVDLALPAEEITATTVTHEGELWWALWGDGEAMLARESAPEERYPLSHSSPITKLISDRAQGFWALSQDGRLLVGSPTSASLDLHPSPQLEGRVWDELWATSESAWLYHREAHLLAWVDQMGETIFIDVPGDREITQAIAMNWELSLSPGRGALLISTSDGLWYFENGAWCDHMVPPPSTASLLSLGPNCGLIFDIETPYFVLGTSFSSLELPTGVILGGARLPDGSLLLVGEDGYLVKIDGNELPN